MNYMKSCTEDIKKAFSMSITLSDVVGGICENFNNDIGSNEITNNVSY